MDQDTDKGSTIFEKKEKNSMKRSGYLKNKISKIKKIIVTAEIIKKNLNEEI